MGLVNRSAPGAVALIALIGLAACSAAPEPGAATSGPAPATTTSTTSAATEPPEPSLDGTIFFFDFFNEDSGDSSVYALRDGTVTVVSGVPPVADHTVSVSPDGTLIAYLHDVNALGPLNVQPVSGAARVVGPGTLRGGSPPVWAPDSGSVVVYDDGPSGPAAVRLDVASGATSAFGSAGVFRSTSWACCVAFSPDLAYGWAGAYDGSQEYVVRVDDASSAVPALPPAGTGFESNGIKGLSPDGRHVIAMLRNADGTEAGGGESVVFPNAYFGANAIVDTHTGARVPIPGGGTLRAGFYLADGNAVLRVDAGGVDTIVLASPAGAVLDEVTVPDEAADLLLLGYAPALG